MLREAIDRSLRAGATDSAAQGKVFLARMLARRGDADEARVVLDEAGELGDVVMAGLA